jgi:protein tyrosine phosphatase (PTP) superfamily phosphohydrolase (DUF442 family)
MDISQITEHLFVGGQPRPEHAQPLHDLGIRLIISMRGEAPPPKVFEQPPFRALWLRTYDTLFTPIPVHKLMEGVQAALPAIERGERVLAHCHHGRHRGVALGAAILIAQGHTADSAMRLLREKRALADPQAWHIRRQIKKFEKHWNEMRNPSQRDASR